MAFVTICPGCDRRIPNVPDHYAGRTFDCPGCGRSFKLRPVKEKQTGDCEVREGDVSAAHLTTCADCGGTVSRMAPACPHCGRPKPRKKSSVRRWLLLSLLVVAGVVGGVLAWHSTAPPTLAQRASYFVGYGTRDFAGPRATAIDLTIARNTVFNYAVEQVGPFDLDARWFRKGWDDAEHGLPERWNLQPANQP